MIPTHSLFLRSLNGQFIEPVTDDCRNGVGPAPSEGANRQNDGAKEPKVSYNLHGGYSDKIDGIVSIFHNVMCIACYHLSCDSAVPEFVYLSTRIKEPPADRVLNGVYLLCFGVLAKGVAMDTEQLRRVANGVTPPRNGIGIDTC